MTFEIGSDQVDVAEIMRSIRARIEEKKGGLLAEAEIREIAEQRLDPALDPGDFESRLIDDLRALSPRWNYSFDANTIYETTRGDALGRLLVRVRRLLRPVLRLLINPSPLVQALYRQSQLNTFYVHLLHESAVEITRLGLELGELRNRVVEISDRLDLLARREKTVEDMLQDAGPSGTPSGAERP
jgi:hypothetical protein